MTDTAVDDRLARLDAVLERLERLGLAAPEVEPLAATPPPHVVAGELIESAWGNAVVDWSSHFSGRIGGIDAPAASSKLHVQADSTVATPDGNGLTLVTFTQPFAARPIVVASNGAYPHNNVIVGVTTINTGNFTLMFYTASGVAAGSQRAEWIAIGFPA